MNRPLRKQPTRSQCRSRLSSLTSLSSHISTGKLEVNVPLSEQPLEDHIRKGQRITGMTSGQASFPVAAPIFKFQQAGKSGAWISELLPHTAKIVDDIAIIKTVNTDAINHDPAIRFIQTGFQQPGRPSMGAWVTYGLGSENQNMPALIASMVKLAATTRRADADNPSGLLHGMNTILCGNTQSRAARRYASGLGRRVRHGRRHPRSTGPLQDRLRG
jgi:Protein of unknown function (DUF1501)